MVTHAASKVKLNRPGANAIKIHAAICEGESISFVSQHAVGGVATEMNAHHMKVWKLNDKPIEATPCTNFKKVFADNGVTEVALFSLDVEGAETQVLAGYGHALFFFSPPLLLLPNNNVFGFWVLSVFFPLSLSALPPPLKAKWEC